ncbi:MAG: biopolymer transporter ExbD [Verrucomicrobiota bacterium]|nr:biopolymer transporter ExbD [Verrucomicrobiota bacterium]
MRLPRNHKVFRGQIDAAPVVGVFFLLSLFLLLHSSIVFTPGVRVSINSPGSSSTNRPVVFIQANSEIRYQGRRYQFAEFEAELREQFRDGKVPRMFLLHTESASTGWTAEQVRALATELGSQVELPGTRIELPEAGELPGTANPAVVVAINLNGQLFFENQIIKEELLRKKLEAAVREARGPLTLILQMDKEVALERFVRLSEMAREAGLQEVVIATRPRLKLSR